MIRKFLINISLAFVSIIIVVILTEVTLKIINTYFTLHGEKCYMPCHIPGLRHIADPNFEKPHFRINSSHLRDSEIPLQKPQRTFRIAVVGNSMTIGHKIPQDSLFTEIIEADFSEYFKDNPHIDIINAGQADYDISCYLPFSQNFVYHYQPDVVCYQFCWNDIAVRPRLEANLPPDQLTRYGHTHSILRKSYLFAQLYKLRRVRPAAERLLSHYENPVIMTSFYEDLFTWAADVRSRGIEFFMVIFPLSLEIQVPESYADITDAIIRRRHELIKTCEENGIVVIDLSGEMRNYYVKNKKSIFMDQGHLNKRGHRLTAELLEKHLICYIPSTKTENSG